MQERIKKIRTEEEQKRNEISDNFNNSLKDITGKIDEQDKEGEAVEKENVV